MKYKLGLKLISLVVLSLLLAVNCAEEGTAPVENIPPNTFVTGYQISFAPDSGTYYSANVYWRGNDEDGAVYWYYWRIFDGADTTGTPMFPVYQIVKNTAGDSIGVDTVYWHPTADLSVTLPLSYPAFDQSYYFQVKAQDNDRATDPTPSAEIIAIDRVRNFNYEPETEIITGPPDGALTGRGVHFVIGGNDPDGVVDSIEYQVDNGSWIRVGADLITHATAVNVRNLAVGPHTVVFRGIDNFRLADSSAVSRSFMVTDTLKPELSLSVSDGQSYVVPFTAPTIDTFEISMVAEVSFYYSAIDSFKVIASTGDTTVTSNASFLLYDLAAGSYWIDVTAYDIGGNCDTTGQVDFSVVELAAGDGILCVNGISWADYGEAEDFWLDGVGWGDRTHFKCWDLFTTAPLGSVPDFADSLLGTGSVLTWMLDTLFFDGVAWFWNAYSGDDDYWYDEDLQAAMMAFLEMGGNLLIAGRYGGWIFDDESTVDFYDYCQISGYTEGLNPTSAVAVHDSVTDISASGSQTLTHTVATSHPSAVQLYETDDGDAGLGWVIIPNGAGGGGAVCFIGGRSYRWTNADLKANIDVVLRYFLGIQ